MRSRDPRTWMWAEACELLERGGKAAPAVLRAGAQPRQGAHLGAAGRRARDRGRAVRSWSRCRASPPTRSKVVIDDGTLIVVAGERPMPGQSRSTMIRRLEIPYGHFERHIELPVGRFEIDRRELTDGCLVLGCASCPDWIAEMTDQMREQRDQPGPRRAGAGRQRRRRPPRRTAARTAAEPARRRASIIVPVRNVVLLSGRRAAAQRSAGRAVDRGRAGGRAQPAPARRHPAAQSGRRGPGTGAAARGRHGRRHPALRHRARRHPSHRRPGPAALPRARVPAGLSVPGRAHRAHRGAGDDRAPRSRRAWSISRSARSRRCSCCRRRRPSWSTPSRRSRRPRPAPTWSRASWTSSPRRSRRSSRPSTSRRGSTRSSQLLGHRDRGAASVARHQRADQGERSTAASASTSCASSCGRSRRSSARSEGTGAEIEELSEAIAKAKMPEEVEEQARKELKRLERMPEAAAEYSMVRTYLDWLIELPWSKLSEDAIDIAAGAPDPRRGPLRPRQDQAAHPRVSRGAQAQPDRQEPDPVLRRPARRRQDLARPEHRARHRAQVRAREPGRRARRGRDPRPPPHLYRRPARQHHPGHPQGRHAQPGVHARRDGQARRELPRRSVLGAARGARSRAELRPSATTTWACRSTSAR